MHPLHINQALVRVGTTAERIRATVQSLGITTAPPLTELQIYVISHYKPQTDEEMAVLLQKHSMRRYKRRKARQHDTRTMDTKGAETAHSPLL